MSTITTNTPASSPAVGKAEEEEPIQGSAPVYDRHILICTGVPAKDWAKKPELSDPYLNLLSTAVRGQGVNVNWTDEPSQQQPHKDDVKGSSSAVAGQIPSKGPRHDLVLFPDNVKFLGLRYEAFKDLSRYLAQHPIGTLRFTLEKLISEQQNQESNTATLELVPGSGELVNVELVQEPSAILVCVHGSRDCRCGDRGGELYRILKDMVKMTGLTNSVKIYGVSHIGGHKYAPNTIMYPSGDWHGNLSELDSEDAQQILFDALGNGGIAGGVRERASDPVMIEKWRGRRGLNKEEQMKLYQQVLEKRRQRSGTTTTTTTTATEQDQPKSLFSAPDEDLYEDDGLKELPNAVSVESNKPAPENSAVSAGTGSDAQKVKVVFETYQKVRTEIEAKVGERILDIVKDKDPSRHAVYQALECTCGGQLECATCHVYIEPPYSARLPAIMDAEEDMLEYAVGRNEETSRLGCQVRVQPDLEGMVIKLPRY
ncbi:hypothetical protein BGZ51_002809 [Haplosporangium sp. Z 767]|nr:hypothetical protein BGZ51_002809 [Haplosporangium sp. Z 767]